MAELRGRVDVTLGISYRVTDRRWSLVLENDQGVY